MISIPKDTYIYFVMITVADRLIKLCYCVAITGHGMEILSSFIAKGHIYKARISDFEKTIQVYILSWTMGSSLGWSSPMVYKLQNNQTDDNPLGRVITDEEASWITSITVLGLAFGALVYGKLPDFIGRRIVFIIIGIPAAISYGMLTFTRDVNSFIAARFLQGLVAGGFCSVGPLYIGELCDSSRRGFFSTITFLMSRFGLIYSYIVGAYAPIFPFNLSLFIISIIFIPLFYLIAPESPYYLVKRDRDTSATCILEKLRGCSGTAIDKELEDIKANATENQEESLIHIIKDKAARRAFVIATSLSCIGNLTGVTSILLYAETFFKDAGTEIPSELCPIIVSGVQLIVGFVAPLTCDKLGRKMLLYISGIGICIPMLILGVYFYFRDHLESNVNDFMWLPPVCLFTAVGSYEVGFASQPQVIMAEIFPMNVKCIGQTCVVFLSAVLGFLITKYLTAAMNSFGMYSVVWFFAFMCVCGVLFVYLFVKETKGKTMNEIQSILRTESN